MWSFNPESEETPSPHVSNKSGSLSEKAKGKQVIRPSPDLMFPTDMINSTPVVDSQEIPATTPASDLPPRLTLSRPTLDRHKSVLTFDSKLNISDTDLEVTVQAMSGTENATQVVEEERSNKNNNNKSGFSLRGFFSSSRSAASSHSSLSSSASSSARRATSSAADYGESVETVASESISIPLAMGFLSTLFLSPIAGLLVLICLFRTVRTRFGVLLGVTMALFLMGLLFLIIAVSVSRGFCRHFIDLDDDDGWEFERRDHGCKTAFLAPLVLGIIYCVLCVLSLLAAIVGYKRVYSK
jgi:hypothetical protein